MSNGQNPKADIESDPARYLGRTNILVEGIDGSGKDEFVRMLSTTLKAHFAYNPDHSLAIVGQPAFRYDGTGQVRAPLSGARNVVRSNRPLSYLHGIDRSTKQN